jgi:hypothetical protein
MPPPTPEMLADPTLGACCRMREGCGELGPYKPFYQSYICAECLKADQDDLDRGEWPFTKGLPPVKPVPRRTGL